MRRSSGWLSMAVAPLFVVATVAVTACSDGGAPTPTGPMNTSTSEQSVRGEPVTVDVDGGDTLHCVLVNAYNAIWCYPSGTEQVTRP